MTGEGWTIGEFDGKWYLVAPGGYVIGNARRSRRAAQRDADLQNRYQENKAKNHKKEARDREAKRAIARFFKQYGRGVE